MFRDELGLDKFAARSREELQARFRGDPRGELIAWLRIAQRREAIVAEAYARDRIELHLEALAERIALRPRVLHLIRDALRLMWEQESAHELWFAALIRAIDPPASLFSEVRGRLDALQGHVEGITVAGLVAPKAIRRRLARLALSVSTLVREPAPFESAVARIDDFSGFCRLNLALEETAIAAYTRMGTLIDQIDPHSPIARVNELVLADERYHAGLFRMMAAWSAPRRDGALLRRLAPEQIDRAMATLERRVYAAGQSSARPLLETTSLVRRDALVAKLQRRMESAPRGSELAGTIELQWFRLVESFRDKLRFALA